MDMWAAAPAEMGDRCEEWEQEVVFEGEQHVGRYDSPIFNVASFWLEKRAGSNCVKAVACIMQLRKYTHQV
jgi:hypothetical protein